MLGNQQRESKDNKDKVPENQQEQQILPNPLNPSNLSNLQNLPVQSLNDINVQNIQNIPEDVIQLMEYPDKSVKITLTAHRIFSFYDINSHLIGSFTINDLVKYISSFVDTENNFMANIDVKIVKSIIETNVCSIIPLQTHGMIEIHLQDPIKTPFMGNINVLMIIYKMLKNFESMELEHMLSSVENKVAKETIYRTIKLFNYTFVEHLLKVIAYISAQIKDDSSKASLREKLLQYSVSLVYSTSQYINSELTQMKSKFTSLNNGLEEIKSNQTLLKQSIESIQHK